MPTHDDNLDKLEDEENGSSIFCCCRSKKYGESKFDTADDSVHVMIAHDKKRASDKGEKVGGYVPRAPHPCLNHNSQPKTEEKKDAAPASGTDGGTVDTEEKSNEAVEEKSDEPAEEKPDEPAEKDVDVPSEENEGDQTKEKDDGEKAEQPETPASD